MSLPLLTAKRSPPSPSVDNANIVAPTPRKAGAARAKRRRTGGHLRESQRPRYSIIRTRLAPSSPASCTQALVQGHQREPFLQSPLVAPRARDATPAVRQPSPVPHGRGLFGRISLAPRTLPRLRSCASPPSVSAPPRHDPTPQPDPGAAAGFSNDGRCRPRHHPCPVAVDRSEPSKWQGLAWNVYSFPCRQRSPSVGPPRWAPSPSTISRHGTGPSNRDHRKRRSVLRQTLWRSLRLHWDLAPLFQEKKPANGRMLAWATCELPASASSGSLNSPSLDEARNRFDILLDLGGYLLRAEIG